MYYFKKILYFCTLNFEYYPTLSLSQKKYLSLQRYCKKQKL